MKASKFKLKDEDRHGAIERAELRDIWFGGAHPRSSPYGNSTIIPSWQQAPRFLTLQALFVYN
jgi:hypothetical protein